MPDKQTAPGPESQADAEREPERLRAIEVAAKDLWERRSGHRMGAADWRAPQECFWALHAALEKVDG
jgi:hypothetical protein